MFRALNTSRLSAQLGSKLSPAVRMQSSLAATSATQTNNKIVLPKPVKRGPTDILYALAATVKRDPTAPHYQFIDDPFLIPKSQMMKAQCQLAIENGRRAARFVMKENPHLFGVIKHRRI